MTYSTLSETTLTDDERLAEKNRIMEIIGPLDQYNLQPNQREFLGKMQGARFVSTSQLFWMRDLKDALV
jgi:hypothetical protein